MVALILLLAAAPPRPIAGPEEVSQICIGTRPAGRFAGPPEERDGFLDRRHRILGAKFEATVPLAELELSDVDEDERTLSYLRPGPLHTREGVTLFPLDRSFELSATSAVVKGEHAMSRLAVAQERTGALRFTYELADPDGAGPCPAGARPGSVPVVLVHPLALALVDAQGALLARGEGDDAPEQRAPAGGKPSVEVAPATVSGPGPLAEVVTAKTRARKEALTACFSEALTRDPTVDGSVVFRLVIDKKGKVQEVETAADTVQDEPLTACARKVLAAVELGKGGPSAALVPVHFDRN